MKKKETAISETTPLELTIDRLGFGGDGVGRHQGKVIFVPRAAPGDRLRVRIVREARRFSFAAIEEILTPSPLRTAPPCPFFERCGGCHLQHLPYAEQLAHKRAVLGEALARIGKCDPPPLAAPLPASEIYGYRNKAYFHLQPAAGELHIGLNDIAASSVLDLPQCLIVEPAIAAAYQAVRQVLQAAWREERNLPCHAFCLRYSASARRGALILIAPPHQSPAAQALAEKVDQPGFDLMLNLKEKEEREMFGPAWFPLRGEGKWVEVVNGFRYPMTPESFFQVNSAMAARLQEEALALLAPAAAEEAVDLYCGSGFFSLPLARCCRRLLGIEISRRATLAAAEAAALNGIANAEFSTGKASRMFQKARRQGFRPSIALADPPRGGLEKELVPQLIESSIARLLYISCSPPTLARDAKLLRDGGFALETVLPLDLFPQTYHVEAAALFRRQR